MKDYQIAVMMLNALVDWMLLLTVNRMSGFPQKAGRCFMAAAIGGIYAGICMIPRFYWMGGFLCRCIVLMLMGAVAYGFFGNGFRRSMLYILVSMALGGIVLVIGDGGILSVIGGGLLFCFAGWFGLGIAASDRKYVEVELVRGNKRERLTALMDTGNCLRDPISGQKVLVADAKCAKTLLGLTQEQLGSPAETVAAGDITGLRLMPFRTVGRSAGMLLAIRLDHVRIGTEWGSAVVAFAPEGLGEGNSYRALLGGTL